jgi:hypothetical protein
MQQPTESVGHSGFRRAVGCDGLRLAQFRFGDGVVTGAEGRFQQRFGAVSEQVAG